MPRAESGAKPIRFAGYAAIFDRVDHGGDVVRRGAFQRSLTAGHTIPLLWQHRPGTVIGRIHSLQEDRRGLRIIAEVGNSEAAKNAARLISKQRLNGLSFGYRVRGSSEAGGLRELTDVDLLEVSVVTHPMQPRARIHAVEAD